MKSSQRAAWRIAACLPFAALLLAPAIEAREPAKKPEKSAVTAPIQPSAQPDNTPWLYRGSDVPQDKEWVFGELSNGLRYAVRKNGVPPGQVSIRVRIDAGSLNEREDERGFAHFIEHLVFRQSKYLGEAQAIPTWQRLGASFGSDTNAETTPTSTMYKLDLPEATSAGLDESFKLLSGMVIAPTLSEANIRTELPIVLAEKRERGGAEERVQDGMRKVIYAGQPLANRAPIGTEQTLNGASQASVRAFHSRWYRPENTVVIVAGDADPAVFAELVKKWFADWPTTGPAVPAPSFGDPVAPPKAVKIKLPVPTAVGEAQVLIEPDLPRSVTWAVLRPWRKVNDTIVYNQGLMLDALAQAVINRRLEAHARAGGSYLVAQVNQQDVSRSVDGTFVAVTPLGPDWQAAIKDVRGVIADALAIAPSQEEIDREVSEMRVAFASSAEQRELLAGSKVADDLATAIDIRETVAAPLAVKEIFEQTVPKYTPRAVLEHTRSLFTGPVTRIVMMTPKQGEADTAALRLSLITPVAGDGGSRLAYKPISFADLPALGTPAKAALAAPTGLPGIEQLDFANGVKAMLWPSADEPGRVTVKVRFGAGYRSIPQDDAAYVTLGEMALIGAGVSTLGQEELDRISTGRKMGFDFKISDSDFTFSADTRRDDLADQLYLFAAKLATPRWDVNPLLRAKAAAKLQYEALASSPQGVLQRDMKWLERDRDGRYRTPTPADIDAATPDGFRALWEPILLSGPVEVQVFGDIDRDQTVAALEKTFGALKSRAPLPESTSPASVKVPAGGGAPVVLPHHGDANQAAAIVFWPTGGGIAGVRESRQLQILTELFTNRLMDRMREKLGASYAPQVVADWPLDLTNGGSLKALAQLQPKDVAAFFAVADEIAADLVARPVTDDELARVIEPLRQQVTRASTSSAYFMYQLEGATADPLRYRTIRTLLPDLTVTTPAAMQALAGKYLLRKASWRLAIVPQGQIVAGATAVIGAMAAPGR